MFRLTLLASAAGVLIAGPAFANDYNPAASARAAADYAKDAAALAPQVPENEALNPQGPTVIASPPVPDTGANRARYGGPMSRAGRVTPPIGD